MIRRMIWLGVGAAVLLPGLGSVDERPTRLLGGFARAEGGEAGEGGEGGVDAEVARRDPVAFGTALAVVDAHLLAGLAAIEAGERELGATLFGHAIAEVYVELEPVLEAQGVGPFLAELEAAQKVAVEGDAGAVRAAVDRVLAITAAAMDRAPADGRSRLAIEATVLAETIDRAALQYQAAASRPDDLEAYLDGVGWKLVAERRAGAVLPQLARAAPEVATALRAAVAALQPLYPAARPGAPADTGAALAAAAAAKLAVAGLR